MSFKDDFYSKKSALGVPNALVLLMIVFFFVPFAFRGARMALQKTENNVKDWLPDDFRETEELAWFAKQFVSEQFIVATWDGCSEDDQRLKMFVSKLRSELEPSEDDDPDSDYFLARKLGAEYGLFAGDDYFFDWGGKNEKWLVDGNGRHFYVTPNGRLYRWEGNSNMVSAAARAVTRATGSFTLEGQFVAGFGSPGTDGAPNPFWQDPRLLTAPLFKSVETGPDLVAELAGENGSLHNRTNPKAGERDAIARLTGTLFGPPVPAGFAWTSDAVSSVLDEATQSQLPEDWQTIWDFVVEQEVEKKFAGDLQQLQEADPVVQSEVWNRFFDLAAVEEPKRQTCVVLTLTPAARSNLGKVLARGLMGQTQGRVFQIAEECGVSAPAVPTMAPPPFSLLAAAPVIAEPVLHVGGPPVDNVAIDEEGTITLVRLIGYSLFLGLVLSWILLRSTRLMMMVFFVGGVSAMACLGMVWWSNASVDAVLLTMPSLVYVLGMAGAIHIVNYYRDAVIQHGPKGAPERAISHAVLPCTLAAITTAIGLVSLCASNILPIRKFGIFSAMGVMATLVLLYTFLPGALSVFPPAARTIRQSGQQAAQGILRFWEAIGAFILRRHWYVNAVCLAAFIALGFGLFRIKTSVQLLKLFDSNAQIIKDYAWLENNFGRLVPMELVVRFPTELQQPLNADPNATTDEQNLARAQLSVVERAEAVSRIQHVLQEEFGYGGSDYVGRGMSAVTLLPEIPEPWAGTDVRRITISRSIHKKLEQLRETDYLAVEEDGPAQGTELWRISLRLGALNDVDYGVFVASLRKAVQPIVAAYHVRSEVLHKLIETTDFNEEAEREKERRVLVLGHVYDAENPPAMEVDPDAEVAVNSEHIFARTVNALFVGQTTSQAAWHDPDVYPLKNDADTQERWAKYLRTFSCLIICKDHPDYDWDFIREANPNIVDARPLYAEAMVTPSSDRPTQPVEYSASPGEMDVVYTGVVPVVYKAQRTLLISLIESVAWAFVLIAVVMTCLLSPARSFLSGLAPANLFRGMGSGAISMIPNVFPVVIIFGFIGWSEQLTGIEILVDIGTMMTASVAMGVAVDDTIHFLTWFREGLKRGLDRRDAIFVAYKHVAPAMTQTTIIAGLGLSVFALSTFTPTQRFGTLMLALLAAALVGDLIFLPALLASPLGRIFIVRPKPESSDDDQESFEAENSSELAETVATDSNAVAAAQSPQLKIRRPQMLRDDSRQKARRKQT